MVFKVGQRVRVVGAVRNHYLIGKEGTITHSLWNDPDSRVAVRGRLVYGIDVDGHRHPIFGDWSVLPEHIAPLTDPGADAFIESVKKWKPEPEAPKAPHKVLA